MIHGSKRDRRVGKTDGKRLHSAQGMDDKLDMHDDKPGVDQELVGSDALAVQVGQWKAMQQVEETGL